MTSHRDYVIKTGRLIGRFEELYRDVEDPWGCSAHVDHLKNRLLLTVLETFTPQGAVVLDVGCGLGALTARLRVHLRPAILHACDVSTTALAKAGKRYPGIHFFPHDIVAEPRLPFPAETFDAIVMSETLWYVLPQIAPILAEYARLLRPAGCAATLNRYFPEGEQQYGREIIAGPEDLIRLADTAGLQMIHRVDLDPQGEHYAIVVFRRADAFD